MFCISPEAHSKPSLIGTPLLPNDPVLIREVYYRKSKHHMHSRNLLPRICVLPGGVSSPDSVLEEKDHCMLLLNLYIKTTCVLDPILSLHRVVSLYMQHVTDQRIFGQSPQQGFLTSCKMPYSSECRTYIFYDTAFTICSKSFGTDQTRVREKTCPQSFALFDIKETQRQKQNCSPEQKHDDIHGVHPPEFLVE